MGGVMKNLLASSHSFKNQK